MNPPESPRSSPLYDQHRALNAKFTNFAGWEMPLEYAGGGVLAEHTAVREAVGIFDVSHLGTVRIRGNGAVAFANRCFTNDLERITAGQAQYTLCCDNVTGGIIDDLIVYRCANNHLLCIPNAANVAEVTRRLTEMSAHNSSHSDSSALAESPAVVDEHGSHAIIAVQGPFSSLLLQRLGLPYAHDYMNFVETVWGGDISGDSAELMVARTGYTGEHGYEIIAPAAVAPRLWEALLTAGAPLRVRPCGLAARDTLRTEMGYPLHGQELTPAITPLQARLSWTVGWKKPQFWGREALLSERQAGMTHYLTGLRLIQPGIPRAGARLYHPGGDSVIGEVTSGTFSPSLRAGIALILLATDSGVAEGHKIEVDLRGRRVAAEVVKPPFVNRSVR